MKNINEFQPKQINFLFTDIDDTITTDGLLTKEAYSAIWKLFENNIQVIPITGRPAGWCEMIARFWPVAGVVGENGGFYFSYDRKQKKMKRKFIFTEAEMKENQKKLGSLKNDILQSFPQLQISSDQFCRKMDLAVDFAEDVGPFGEEIIQQVLNICKKHGAEAKVSSIHINTWFGKYDKLSMCKTFTKEILQQELKDILEQVVFCGDSPNDEPMFSYFQNSFAVANFLKFSKQVTHLPTYITDKPGGAGFAQIVERILS